VAEETSPSWGLTTERIVVGDGEAFLNPRGEGKEVFVEMQGTKQTEKAATRRHEGNPTEERTLRII